MSNHLFGWLIACSIYAAIVAAIFLYNGWAFVW